MKKEVCLMCIVCFFLGYFVCDVIGKCGFKKPPPPHEHLGDYSVSSDSLSEEEFGGYSAESKQLRSKNLSAKNLSDVYS